LTITALLNQSRSLGARLRVDGDDITVDMPNNFPDDLLAQMKQRKQEILAYFNGQRAGFVAAGAADLEIERLVCEVAEVAGDSLERWRTIRKTFRRNYRPTMYRIDGQDILVAWAGANLYLTTANRDLQRIGFARRNTTLRQRAARDGKLAEIRFWSRSIAYWEPQVLMTFSINPSAARLLESVLRRLQRNSPPQQSKPSA
jgi:hypothetical protein